jgi:hypothetical protein
MTGVRTLIIVEGVSDQLVVEAVAKRMGRDLASDGVSVVPIGGAHAIARFLETAARETPSMKLAGLCDAGEEGVFRQALERAGLGSNLNRAQMETLGFFACSADLEDELIRALGPGRIEEVVDAQGDLEPWRTFQKQPAQRGRDQQQQLRRFIRSISGRNVRYLLAMVQALEVNELPRPLRGLLAHV